MAIKPRKVATGYQARYTGSDGKQYSAGVFKTQRDAAAAAALKEAEVRGGDWENPDRGKITFAEFAEQAMKIRAGNLAPNTVAAQRSRLRVHLLPKFGKVQLRHITTFMVESWWADLPKTPNDRECFMVLSALLKMAVKYKHLDHNPCSKVEGASKDRSKVRQAIEQDDAWTIIEHADPMLRAFLTVMLGTGLRPGEALGLDRRHIDLDARVVLVEQQLSRTSGSHIRPTTKTGKPRKVALPEYAIAEVRAYLATQPAMFGMSPLWLRDDGQRASADVIARRLRKAIHAAGITGTVSLHQFRHASLTEALAASGDIAQTMERAGHGDMRSFKRYQHGSKERDIAVANAMDERRTSARGRRR